MKWTEDFVSILRGLVAKGLTCDEIATTMGNGLTRNAVVGKVHRLGISMLNSSGPQKGVRPVRKPSAPKPIKMLQIRSSMPYTVKETPFVPGPEGGLTLLEREPGQCAWPLDNGNYCGATTEGIRVSYCEVHHRHGHSSPVTAGERAAGYEGRTRLKRFTVSK